MDQVGYVTVLILQLDTRRCWSNLNGTANQQQSWDQPLCTVWVGLQSFPPAPLECSVALWLGLHLPSTHVAWTNSRQAHLCLLFFTTYWAWPSLFFFQTAGCGIHKPEESRRERRKAKYLDIQGKCWSSLLVENLFIDALHWPTGSRPASPCVHTRACCWPLTRNRDANSSPRPITQTFLLCILEHVLFILAFK